MKSIIKFSAIIVFLFTACKQEKTATTTEGKKQLAGYHSFGDKISTNTSLTSKEMLAKFNSLKIGDTIDVTFASSIQEVCSKKGCWMKLPLGETTETMVRFKDYGFFMPLDSKDREVIVAGKAFIKETSIKDLRHYAEDAGKSKEEIAKITASKREFAFEANGVLMKVK